MIQELVFTSAPRGLKLGSSGFCTVASTPGMAANLAKLLESLSGYRHLNPPGSANASFNPVVYSHVKTKIGGKTYHIVSRISDAGFDYSNRSNKLAHHFAIEKLGPIASGPAAILKNGNQFFSQWDQEPAKLNPKTLSGALPVPRPCNTWKAVAGDAGWAGNVIEAFQKKKTTYVVVEPSTPALDLVDELMALLPLNQQWNLTFSTFYTKASGNIDCNVRFVMAGSPEVALARRSQANVVIDLTQNLGRSNSELADNARNGLIVSDTKNRFSIPSVPQTVSSEPIDNEDKDLELAIANNDLELDDTPPELTANNPSYKTYQAPPALKSNYKPGLPKSEIVVTKRESKLGKIVFAAILAVLLIGLGASLPYMLKRLQLEVVEVKTDPQKDTGAQGDVKSTDNQDVKSPRGAQKSDTDGGDKPNTDGGDKSNTDGGDKPNTDGGDKPNTDGGDKPNTDGAGKPDTDGAGKPNTDGAGKPKTSSSPKLKNFKIVEDREVLSKVKKAKILAKYKPCEINELKELKVEIDNEEIEIEIIETDGPDLEKSFLIKYKGTDLGTLNLKNESIEFVGSRNESKDGFSKLNKSTLTLLTSNEDQVIPLLITVEKKLSKTHKVFSRAGTERPLPEIDLKEYELDDVKEIEATFKVSDTEFVVIISPEIEEDSFHLRVKQIEFRGALKTILEDDFKPDKFKEWYETIWREKLDEAIKNASGGLTQGNDKNPKKVKDVQDSERRLWKQKKTKLITALNSGIESKGHTLIFKPLNPKENPIIYKVNLTLDLKN